MKKLLFSIITVMALLITMPVVRAENKVKVYMFTKDGCPACESAFEYFDQALEDEPDLFELVTLEVWDESWKVENQDLYDLLISVLDNFEVDYSEGLATPTIVVGDYVQVGAQNIEEMHERITTLKNAEDPKEDAVEKLAKEAGIDIDAVKLNRNENTSEPEKTNKYDAIIIIGIFVVLIGGFAALVIMGKK